METTHGLLQTVFIIFVTVLEACLDIANSPCCRDAVSEDFVDNDVSSISQGSCVFDNTLCAYTQGCADSSMTYWTPHPGFASAYQWTDSYIDDRSVLVSPLLAFTQDGCFQARYAFHSYANLDGFVDYNDSAYGLLRLIHRKQGWISHDVIFQAETTLRHSGSSTMFGRVKIRAKAGGYRNQIRLYSVLVSEGRCERQSCDFNTDFCEWEHSGWQRSHQLGSGTASVSAVERTRSGQFAHLSTREGTLTTPLMRKPGHPSADCVTFKYIVKGEGSSLQVTLDLSDGSFSTAWSIEGHGYTSRRWRDGKFPVRVSQAYRISFQGALSSSSSAIVALDNVQVSPIPHATCGFEPSEAWTDDSFHTTGPPAVVSSETGGSSPPASPSTATAAAETGTSQEGQGSSPGETTGSVVSFSTGGALDDGHTSGREAVIGGSVAAVVLLIVVIVVSVVVVVWRKRRIERTVQKHGAINVAFTSKEEGGGPQTLPHSREGDYTQIPHPHPFPDHARAADRDGVPSHDDVTASKDDVSPYEIPDDEPRPAKPHGPNYVNVLRPQNSSGAHVRTEGTAEDTYNHIRTTKDAPFTSATEDDYSHITGRPQNVAQPRPEREPGKSEAAGKAQKSQADPGHGYSLVRRRDGIPPEDPARGQEQGEYDRLHPAGSGARQTTGDAASRPDTVPTQNTSRGGQYYLATKRGDPSRANNVQSLGESRASAQYSRIEDHDRTCEYSLQKPLREELDEYNTLDFEMSSQSHQRGQAGNPYDHVRNDPDGDYCKTRIGQRNIVIDSDYDRVRH